MAFSLISSEVRGKFKNMFPSKCVLGQCGTDCCQIEKDFPETHKLFERFKKATGIPNNYRFPHSWVESTRSARVVLLMVWVYHKMKDHPPSHDFYHVAHVWYWTNVLLISMLKDGRFTRNISMCEYSLNDFRELVQICAMLHEINDHKYEPGAGRKEMEEMMTYVLPSSMMIHIDMIFNIIASISFSKEKAGKVPLLPYFYQIARDVVSDADKITALGAWGLQRCLMYLLEKGGGEKSDDELSQFIIYHHKEKLGLLPAKYIRTSMGRGIAQEKLKEMDVIFKGLPERVNEWRKQYQ